MKLRQQTSNNESSEAIDEEEQPEEGEIVDEVETTEKNDLREEDKPINQKY